MLVSVGFNHRSAPVAIRERLAMPEASLPERLARLRESGTLAEALILSTCNRVELLGRAGRIDDGLLLLREYLEREQRISAAEIERYSYQHVGREAAQHLFRVASGLDSMILGEPQILGQVKQAYRVARESGATGPVLERLLQHCLATAKRVRTETGISRHAVSVAFAAVQLGRRIFGELGGRRVLLLGAGKMSTLVARHLVTNGVDEVIVASRSFSHASEMAAETGGRAVNWEDGLAHLAQVDIVVSCTDAPHAILTKQDVARAVKARRGEPLFLIDIAVPRDIEPAVNDVDNAYLYDIDGLQGVVDANLEERRLAAEKAERLIETEVDSFFRWRQTQTIAPTIVALREALYDIGRGELERARNKLGPMSEQQHEAVEQLTRAVIQKILHRPIRHLRGAVERGDVGSCIALYHDLFGIDESAASARGAAAPPEEPLPGSGPRRVLKGGKDG